MPTRKQVAERAGVSPAVVSYVLNNKSVVRESTRQKVLQAIDELGYQPDLLARSLKTGRTGQVGVLVHNLGNPFEAGILLHLEQAAREHGFLLFFHHYRAGEENELRALWAGRVDGVVLLGQRLPDDMAQFFVQRGTPLVSILRPAQDDAVFPWIDIDWRAPLGALLRHLRSCAPVAFLGASEPDHPYHVRKAAFVQAAQTENVATFDAPWLRAAGSFESAHELIHTQLKQGALPFRALVCANDLMALGALAACRENNVAVPGKLSIAGCEDILMSGQSNPPLTTIHYPRPDVGRAAFALLDQQRRGETVENVVLEDAQLVVRAST